MNDRLLVGVMGNRNAGKSKTWTTLFERSVRTGRESRYLYLNDAQWVDDVFLVNGSPQEREVPIEQMMPEKLPTIVLCSVQYKAEARETFSYFIKNGYDIFLQWLNPGYSDSGYADELSLIDWLIRKGAVVCNRSGKEDPESRVSELKQQILGWAQFRDLVRTEF